MQHSSSSSVAIALGSNSASSFGPPLDTVLLATHRISELVGTITGKSRMYITPCFPAGAGPDFINAVVLAKTSFQPDEILQLLHQIEADFGRERVTRWGQRTLDLDLLCSDQLVLPNAETHMTWRNMPREVQAERAPDELILPHPRLQDRAFVLVPMADVAPDWVHPILGKTTVQMRDALPTADINQVVPTNAT